MRENSRMPFRRLSVWTLTFLLLSGAFGAAPAADPAITVHTDAGAVIGTTKGGVAAFLGIPYAAAPTGDLRFRPPQPHPPWATPIQANAYGSPCPQSAQLGSGSTNEDCLFVNVWSPLLPGGRKPVMLFIHGGGFVGGNGGVNPGGPDFGGPDIARGGDVVVATINYRLGVLGFLAAPALDGESPQHVSGNYGLLDQQAALAWVRRNIAWFGGDPSNVTIFGESAGAASVLLQIVSPGASGLFQRAIAESGADSQTLPLAAGEGIDANTVAALGCGGAADVAACLRAVPATTIIASGAQVVGPVIDGVTLPQQPLDALKAGTFNHVPSIIGTNLNEGTYFVDLTALGAGRALTAADYQTLIGASVPSHSAQVQAAYPLSAYRTPGDALAAITTDSLFACGSERVRQAIAASTPVWSYEFAEPVPALNVPLPPPLGIDLGDAHTTELAYVFGHDGSGNPLSGRDASLARQVIGYWTRLAHSGNPNIPGNVLSLVSEVESDRAFWPRYARQATFTLTLKARPSVSTDFAARHQCAFWESIGSPEVVFGAVPQ